MKKLWSEFEHWLELNCPETVESFNEPATKAEIAKAEQKMRVKLPNSLKELLLIHNGQRNEYPEQRFEYLGAIGNYDLLTLDEIVYTWETMKELLDNKTFEDFEEVVAVGPVKKGAWWNPRWISIATNGMGDDICIDLDPAEGGTEGQIITFWHDWEERKVISRSLEEWFGEITKCLEDGTYKLIEEDGELVFNNDGFMGE
ncbi:SMI1/KNR4 family protein [Cytobacillus firmus]|uniref:SMI1/KNR4 family protein n=1 Tax=Cytobacillus firmus TaxID=1399 RepID=UPI00222818F2|nr:SMI1/KNR4 family protein [Cytobacillus firmus]